MKNEPNIPDHIKQAVADRRSLKEFKQGNPLHGKPTERVMPVVYRGGIIKVEWFRKFTFRERLAIMFGANFTTMTGIACQHKAGAYQPMIVGKVSKHPSPDEHMREAIENMLLDKESPITKLMDQA